MLQKERLAEIKRYKMMIDRLIEMNKLSLTVGFYCRDNDNKCKKCALNFGIKQVENVSACANLNHPWAEAVMSAKRLKRNLDVIIKRVESDIIIKKAKNIKKRRNG